MASTAKNQDNFDGTKNIKFAEFSNIWRSTVTALIAILQYQQYIFLNDLLFDQNVINFSSDEWEKSVCWRKAYIIVEHLFRELEEIETNNDLEEEQKIEDVNYLTDLVRLLEEVGFSNKVNVLTLLPTIPKSNLANTSLSNQCKGIFEKLLQFYAIVNCHEDLSYANLLNQNKKIFEGIFNKKQEFDNFIKNYTINQDQCEDALQHWTNLQEFLTTYYGENEQNGVLVRENQFSNFESIVKSLTENELKLSNHTENIFSIAKKLPSTSMQLELTEDVERLFLILLLNISFDINRFTKTHNFLFKYDSKTFHNDWRRMLHVPITILEFQQFNIHSCNLNLDESKEWMNKKKKATEIFMDVGRQLISFITNVLNRLTIFPNMAAKLNQSIQDSEYLHKLLQILQEMIYLNIRNISSPLPQIPKLFKELQSINENDDQSISIARNLYNLYQLTYDGNSIKSFSQWNNKMFDNVFKNLHSCNTFIKDYTHNRSNSNEIVSLWNDFNVFLKEYKNQNKLSDIADEENCFIKIYRLIFSDNFECTTKYDVLFTMVNEDIQKNETMQMQLYIILLLNVSIDVRHFYNNDCNNYSNISINCRSLALQSVIQFKFRRIENTISTSIKKEKLSLLESMNITDGLILIQRAIKGVDLEDSVTLHKFLDELKYIFQHEHIFKSTEIFKIIETTQKAISNFTSYDDFREQQQYVICNLFYYWRICSGTEIVNKKNFYEWNKKMYEWIFLNLDQIECFITSNVTERQNYSSAEIWDCFRGFLLNHHGLNESYNAKNNYHAFFQSLIDEKTLDQTISELQYTFNYININMSKDYRFVECGILYLLIFLDESCSLVQLTNAFCWQKMYDINFDINCCQFHHCKVLNNKKMIKEDFLSRSTCEIYEPLKNFRTCLYIYDKLHNMSKNIYSLIPEIERDDFQKDAFCLDEIESLLLTSFPLRKVNNVFLINLCQLSYLQWYFENVSVNGLEEKSFPEKIQYMLDFYRENFKELNELIRSYFGNYGDIQIFLRNWGLIKDEIHGMSERDNKKPWQLLYECDKFAVKDYFKTLKSYKSVLTIKMNEKNAAKHFLLILLNVPLSEILKTRYREALSLDKLFLLMYHYKKLKQSSSNDDKTVITSQYDLAMKKFTTKLEDKQTFTEAENESANLLVKSEFNKLDYTTKKKVIENLIDIVYSQNTFGWLIIILKIFLSLLPILDIFLDVLLAIKFYMLNEKFYSYFTIGILIIAGLANVVTEVFLKKNIQWKPTYCVTILKHQKLKYILSFTQVTLFLRALNEAMLRLRIKKNKDNSYLDYINYGNPELLKREINTLKYVEMCFEAMPQTILQLYIILMKNNSDLLQLFSILNSTCSIIATVWTYISSRHLDKEMSFCDHRALILREFCFYGLKIISSSLILRLFPWTLPLWIGIRFLINFIIEKYNGDDKKNYLYFFKSIHTDLIKKEIYNIITLVEFVVLMYIFIVYYALYHFDNIYYCVLIFAIYPTLLFIWFVDLYRNKFSYDIKEKDNTENNNEIFKIEKYACNMYCSIIFRHQSLEDEESEELD